MPNFTTNLSVATPIGTISGTGVETADGEAYLDTTLGIGTDVQYDVSFKYTTLKSIIIYSAGAVTLKFNSTSVPAPSITIPAGEAFQWRDGDAFANPFTADVTKVYITSAAAGAFKLAALYDATP